VGVTAAPIPPFAQFADRVERHAAGTEAISILTASLPTWTAEQALVARADIAASGAKQRWRCVGPAALRHGNAGRVLNPTVFLQLPKRARAVFARR